MSTRALEHNITTSFEQAVAIGLDETMALGTVQPAIEVDDRPGAIRTPFADSTGTIHIQETFTDYVWAVIYSLLVILDEGINKRLIDRKSAGDIICDTPLLMGAKQLLDWALTLRLQPSPWPPNAPNPNSADRGDETGFYAKKANGLFQDAIAYILCHEFGHLVTGNFAEITRLRNKPSHLRTAADLALLKQIESEADNFAQVCLHSSKNKQTNAAQRAFAIVLVQCADLLLLTEPKAITQSLHPDVDQRLLNAILCATHAEHVEENLWLMASFAARRFFEVHGLEIADPKAVLTPRELFDYYLAEFDKIKERQ